MTPTVDDLLRAAEAQFDQTICDLALEHGNRLLAAGARPDDLLRLMAPFAEAVRRWRAQAMADMYARATRIRLLEARMRLNEALMARMAALEAQIERLEATVH